MRESRPRRTNGLSRPYTTAQISAWVAFVVSLVQFGLFISPILPLMASIPVSLIFLIVCCLVCFHGGKTVLINPIDIHLYQTLKEREGSTDVSPDEEAYTQDGDSNENEGGDKKKTTNNKKITTKSGTQALSWEYKLNPLLLTTPVEEMKQCWICDTQVAKHSMHCKFCNKCVYKFDHHCLWLNTCIGKSNYKHFFRTMLSLFCMELVHFVIQVVLIVDIFTEGPTKDRSISWVGNHYVVAGLLIGFSSFNAMSMFLIGQLIWLHIGLQNQNLTTYEFIVMDSKKKRELSKLKGDLERQRVSEIEQAKQNNDRIRSFRLVCGGFCRNRLNCAPCDPLDLPEPYEPDPDAGFALALGSSNDNHPSSNGIKSKQTKQEMVTAGANDVNAIKSDTTTLNTRNNQSSIVEKAPSQKGKSFSEPVSLLPSTSSQQEENAFELVSPHVADGNIGSNFESASSESKRDGAGSSVHYFQ